MRIIQRQVIKGIIIQAMVQSGVVMTGNADRIEAGAEAASNEILEEMKMDPSGGNRKEAHGQIVYLTLSIRDLKGDCKMIKGIISHDFEGSLKEIRISESNAVFVIAVKQTEESLIGTEYCIQNISLADKMSRRDAVTILARSVKDMLIKLNDEQPKGACKAMGKFMEAFRDGANTYMLEHIDEIMAGKEGKHGR